MKGAGQPLQTVKRIASLWALAAGLALPLTPVAALAEDAPFQIENGHWMSFDHYKDASQRGIVASTAPVADTPVITPPTLPAAADATPAADAASAATPTDTTTTAAAAPAAVPAVAPPKRALDLPPMPGLNKGYTMKVSTTEDDTPPPPPVSQAANGVAEVTGPKLPDKNWQDPASAVHFKQNAAGQGDEVAPLDVRMTFLPDGRVTPAPSPDHSSTQHAAREALEKSMATKPKPKTAQEQAVCAAIDAYKKQQLDAIQSDRQTLKALQEAIASMGLQKQLGFMTGSDSALNQSTPATPVTIDAPAPTIVR